MDDPRKIYADNVARAVSAAGRRPRRPIEFRSQHGEDAFLWELFQGQLDGFYIEVGAFDGATFSVSYAFDCVGWNGLLIEPIPERYRECVANRPTARVVHAALGPHNQPPTTTFHVTQDQFGGMLSSRGDGAPPPTQVGMRTIEVPLTTMDALLGDYQGEIDFAVIDVEGGELPLLEGFSLERYRPKVLLIECEEEDLESLVNYLVGRKYFPIGRQAINTAFARADLAEELTIRLHGPDAFR